VTGSGREKLSVRGDLIMLTVLVVGLLVSFVGLIVHTHVYVFVDKIFYPDLGGDRGSCPGEAVAIFFFALHPERK
jgi:hypothetical protein